MSLEGIKPDEGDRAKKSTSSIRWGGLLLAEILILMFSLSAYGRRATRSEGNQVARLFLDDPGFWESLLFYEVAFHVLIVGLILFARWYTRNRTPS